MEARGRGERIMKVEETQHNGVSFFRVSGPSVQALLKYALPRIRQRSRAFYEKEIKAELESDGEALVDRHAGQGSYYLLVLDRQ